MKKVLASWGPGKFDAELNLDGKAFRPDGKPATLIPPAFGLAGVNQHTWTGRGQCSTCHVPPLFTEAGWNTHKGSEIGIDDFQSDRSPDRSYRTTPLRGLTTHAKGGFYHDGRFPDLMAVVEHYNQFMKLGLSDAEKHDLVEYLKSL